MKEYKRLTGYMQVGNKIVAIQPQRKERIQVYIDRLFELEDKIESGELRNTEEVRKETAKEILQMIKEKGLLRYGRYLLDDSDFTAVGHLYGVEVKE